jgi:type I site-specific restriction-modification system R (restriction) subunit
MSKGITESVVEDAALDWLGELGYEVLSGLAIAPGEPAAERVDYKQVFLFDRLQTKLEDLNPKIPLEGLQEALRKLRLISHPTLIENNRAFHRLLVEGVDVEFRNADGQIVHDKVWLIDFANPEANEFLAVNQFTVEEGHFNRRADVVVFINGIPLAVLELKNIADEQATIRKAFDQFQTYKAQICTILHGFDYGAAAEATAAKRLPLIAQAAEHVLQQKDGKPRYLQAVSDLSKAFALAVPHDSALEIRDEVGFFQEIRAVLAKSISEGGGKSPEELELAVRQIVSRAISSDKVIDIFDAAGLKKPDISILSDEFLAEVNHLPQRNLAVELLQKLLNNELKIRSKKYLVQSRSFAEMLEATIRRYQNRTIEAAQVIAELIELAKQMREGQKRGDKLGLTDDEVAFYDALETNDSAVKVLGEPTLKNIARELVSHVRKSVTIDWTLRESAQAQIRVPVRRILRKYGYPPDKQEKATQTVLEQAKLLCEDWAEG